MFQASRNVPCSSVGTRGGAEIARKAGACWAPAARSTPASVKGSPFSTSATNADIAYGLR